MSVPSAPTALWDFSDADDPLSANGGSGVALEPATAAPVPWAPDATVGGYLGFAGDGSHLRIPASRAGLLDFGGRSAVSVFALIRRSGPGVGFIAGLWQEFDADPRRQYGLFVSLHEYGGAEQVNGHVSSSGGATPGLPFNRDYAATARMVRPGVWRVVGFRYDGHAITAFLDGIADPRPSFTEQGPPIGEGLSYPKNPYPFSGGLFQGARADFTVGAVRLTSGVGNAFHGDLARLAIWDRPLTDAEVWRLTQAWTPPGEPLARFDWWRPIPSPGRLQGGWDGEDWPPASTGWQVTGHHCGCLKVHPGHLVRRACDHVVELSMPTPGLALDQIAGFSVQIVACEGEAELFLDTPSGRHTAKLSASPATPIALRMDALTGPARPGSGESVEQIGLRFGPGGAARLGEVTVLGTTASGD